jgi:hypothetical protein
MEILTHEPTYEMVALVPDPDNPGQFIPGVQRKYQLHGFGQKLFMEDRKYYRMKRDKRLQLISLLCCSMSKDVKGKCDAKSQYRARYDEAKISLKSGKSSRTF